MGEAGQLLRRLQGCRTGADLIAAGMAGGGAATDGREGAGPR